MKEKRIEDLRDKTNEELCDMTSMENYGSDWNFKSLIE